MRTKRLALPIILVLALAGCAKQTITNLPPGVTQSQVLAWTSAVNSMQTISDSVHLAKDTVIQMNRSGAFPDSPEYITAIETLQKILQSEIAANTVLKKSPENFSQPVATQISALAIDILTQLATLTGNTNSIQGPTVQTLRNAIAAMQLAAQTARDLRGTP